MGKATRGSRLAITKMGVLLSSSVKRFGIIKVDGSHFEVVAYILWGMKPIQRGNFSVFDGFAICVREGGFNAFHVGTSRNIFLNII